MKATESECAMADDSFDTVETLGEMVTRRLQRLAEHYDRMSKLFMPGDVRGPMMAEASKAMRLVIEDSQKDFANGLRMCRKVTPQRCAKCSGSGMVQRWTGEYVECDACNARGF